MVKAILLQKTRYTVKRIYKNGNVYAATRNLKYMRFAKEYFEGVQGLKIGMIFYYIEDCTNTGYHRWYIKKIRQLKKD